MLKYATVALCAVALLACQKPEAPAASKPAKPGANKPSDVRNAKVNEVIPKVPQFVDHALLGSEIGPDGTVSKESSSIPQGKPVYLTMVFRESPPGLQASAVWSSVGDKHPINTERKEMNGGKVATFALPPVKPGRYRVVGYWGGNVAAQREFEIVAPQKGKGKKG
jgi:hypothetical protein